MILASVTNSAIWSNASIPWFCFFQNFVFYNFHLAGTKIILPLYKLCYKLMPKSVNNMADSRWCYNSVLKFRMLRQIIKTRQTSLILLASGVCGDDVIRLLVHIAQSIGSIPLKPKKCKNQIFTEKPGDWGFLPGDPGLGQLRDLKSYHCSGPSPPLTRGRRTG